MTNADKPPEPITAQAELATMVLRSAVPDLTQTFNRLLLPYNQMVAQSLESNMKSLVEALAPKMDDLPALRLDFETLFPNLTNVSKELAKSLLPSAHAFHDLQREQFARLLDNVRNAVDSMLPPNWRGPTVPFPPHLETMLLDEGLPLAWVPPKDVLAKVFAAKTSGDRRRIIGSNWKSITTACRSELAGVDDSDLREYTRFAAEAAEALLEGSPSASQALSANLLDTILRRSFSKDSRQAVTDQANPPNIDDYSLRVAIVIGGIWGSHSEYRPYRGDLVPFRYSRHASAHGVSSRQYSRVNAVIALMHVVGLIKLMDVDLSRLACLPV